MTPLTTVFQASWIKRWLWNVGKSCLAQIISPQNSNQQSLIFSLIKCNGKNKYPHQLSSLMSPISLPPHPKGVLCKRVTVVQWEKKLKQIKSIIYFSSHFNSRLLSPLAYICSSSYQWYSGISKINFPWATLFTTREKSRHDPKEQKRSKAQWKLENHIKEA